MKRALWYNIIRISMMKIAAECGGMEIFYMNMKKFFKALIPAVISASAFSAATLNAFAESGSGANAQASSPVPMIISLVVVFVLMYFLMIRPQKKKEKESKEMQNNIQIGDEIVTIGGIVGLVVRKGDDNVVIETGGEKNKMRIKLWAISENTSALERAKSAQDKKSQNTGLASGKLKEEEDSEKKSKKSKKKSDDEE